MSDRYDAGLFGGDTTWSAEDWHDYLRAELGRWHDFYSDQIETLEKRVADAESVIASINSLRDKAYEERGEEIEELRTMLLTQSDTNTLINAMHSEGYKAGVDVAFSKLGRQEAYLKARANEAKQ